MWIYFILLVIIAGLQLWYFQKPLAYLYFNESYWSPEIHHQFEIDLLIGLVIAWVVVNISRYISTHTQWGQNIDDDFTAIFHGMPKYYLSGLAIMSALCEEVLFRGFLQNYFGLMWTSILFGALHIPMQKHHWLWTIAACIMGFVFGACYEWRATLTAPLIAHFTINYFNLHALAQRTPTGSDHS
jgi:uncharacterized protein